jgi:hypothetical protein
MKFQFLIYHRFYKVQGEVKVYLGTKNCVIGMHCIASNKEKELNLNLKLCNH